MLRRVALVKTDVSEERSASFIRVTRIGQLGTTLAVRFISFEIVTAVTMKNIVFWDTKTQFVPQRRHIMSPLQNPAC
jgi:hypothetical protein